MRLRAALLGVVAGALGGFVLLSWGVAMPWFGLIALAVGGFAPPRPFGLAGTLIGWGALSTILFLRAGAACDPASCSGPGVGPWLVASLGLLAAGVLVGAVALGRARTTDAEHT